VSETEARIRDYLLRNYLFTDDQSKLDSGASLLEKGIIDSTGIMEVILFLEEEFGVVVEDDELILENFDSVDNLVKFINANQGSSGAKVT